MSKGQSGGGQSYDRRPISKDQIFVTGHIPCPVGAVPTLDNGPLKQLQTALQTGLSTAAAADKPR